MENFITTLSLEKGDRVKEKLAQFMEEKNWTSAVVTGALGSVVDVTVGNAATTTIPPEVNYTDIPGPFEVLSFCGEICKDGSSWYIHIHMAGSYVDATVCGGGMKDAVVFKGLKIFLVGS